MQILQTIMVLLVGFLFGGSFPFALLYLVVYVKRHRFSWRLVLGFLARLVLIPVVIVIFLGGSVALLEWAGIDLNAIEQGQASPDFTLYFGSAAGFGLLAGIVAFVAGIVSAIRSKMSRNN